MKLSSTLFISIIIIILIFTISFIFTYLFLFQDKLYDAQESEATSLALISSSRLANPVYFLNVEEIKQILSEIHENKQIISADVFLTDGTNISNIKKYEKTETEEFLKFLNKDTIVVEKLSDSLIICAPIMIQEQIGTLVIEYSLLKTQKTIQNSLLIIIGVSFLSSGIAGIISFSTSKKITRNLSQIALFSNILASGKKPEKIDISNIDELDSLKTNLEEMEKKLEAAKLELIKVERFSAIGEISARVAHDLRNPLNVLKQAIELIQHTEEKQLSLKTKEYLDMMKIQVDRINHQINEVLGFVKSHKTDLEIFSFKKFLNDSIKSIKIPSNVKILIPDEDVLIRGDVEQLRVVFTNILLNSIQELNEKGEIHIRVYENEENIRIEIEDSGAGIKEEDLERVFEPLFTTKQEGTGLGLASCKTIIKEHDGEIFVKNSATGGVIFTIILPKNNLISK